MTLVISNWTGVANTVGTAATDRLIFNSSQAANLASFSFAGYTDGATQCALDGGFYEVTPITPVPDRQRMLLACLRSRRSPTTSPAVIAHDKEPRRL